MGTFFIVFTMLRGFLPENSVAAPPENINRGQLLP
jgi:hypothetical protein